jgi:hypothetical protein
MTVGFRSLVRVHTQELDNMVFFRITQRDHILLLSVDNPAVSEGGLTVNVPPRSIQIRTLLLTATGMIDQIV